MAEFRYDRSKGVREEFERGEAAPAAPRLGCFALDAKPELR
ncbi:hypothetical protein ACFYMW_18355 [Streptomyces sp. NPDC006692]